MTQPSLDEDLGGAISEFDFPIALVRLDDLRIVALSRSWVAHLGVPALSLIGRPALDMIRAEDRSSVEVALMAVRAGAVEFHHAHRRMPGVPPGSGLGSQWVRRFEIEGERYLLVEAAAGSATHARPLSAFLGEEPAEMLIGVTDNDWVIRAVSSEVEKALCIAPHDAVGRRFTDLVDPRDVGRLLSAGKLATGENAVCLYVRMPNATQPWARIACVLAALAGSKSQTGSRAFVLLRLDLEYATSGSRVAQLERHLWNIMSEVEASGILEGIGQIPDVNRLHKMGKLTVRQWEIVGKLLHGERVPQIAKDLFVSQSTIRNHLSQVFERFGVHSQAELIDYLRKAPAS